MKQKSKQIVEITYKEIKLLKQLARTGITDRFQIKKFYKIKPSILEKLESTKYIRINNTCVAGRNTQIIRLDKSGSRFCREKLGLNVARTQSNYFNHDLILTYAYNSLNEEMQDSWEHRKEIIKDVYEKNPNINEKYLNDKGKLLTCIDARVTVNGVTTGIEVLSKRGGKAERELKEEMAINLAGCSSVKFFRQ
jgi:hypothetical protein